jgi:hypothetical protein
LTDYEAFRVEFDIERGTPEAIGNIYRWVYQSGQWQLDDRPRTALMA